MRWTAADFDADFEEDEEATQKRETATDFDASFDEPSYLDQLAEGASNLASGAGEGLYRVGQGVEQLFNKYVPNPYAGPDFAERRDAEIMRQRAEYDATPAGQSTAGAVGQFLGEVAPTLAIPGGVAGGLMTRLATGAAAGAGTGAAQFVEPGGSQSRAENIAFGGALGGVAPLALSGAKGLWNVGRNAVQPGRAAALNPLLQQGAEHNVPIYASDVAVGQKRLEDMANASFFPGAILGPRGVQAEAAEAAAKRLKNPFDELMRQPAQHGSARLASMLPDNQYFNRSTDLLEEIDTLDGTDRWQRILQTSADAEVLKRKITAAGKYDRVQALAGDTPLVPELTRRSTKKHLAAMKEDNLPDKTLFRLVKELDDALGGKNQTFNSMRRTRSRLSDRVQDYLSGANETVGKSGVEVLAELKRMVDTDLEKFARKQGGDLEGAWREADSYWREAVVPYRNKALAKVINEEYPDKVFHDFRLASKSKDEFEQIFNFAGEKGQQAARYGYLAQGVEKAFKDENKFSPALYRNYIRDTKNAREVLFKDEATRDQIAGVHNIMKALQEAQSSAAHPATGARLAPLLNVLAGGAVGGTMGVESIAAGAAAGNAVAGPLLGKLLTNPMYTRLVAEAADPKEVSRVLDYIVRSLRQSAVVDRARADSPEELNSQ